MHDKFFRHMDITEENVHILYQNAPDLELEYLEYD